MKQIDQDEARKMAEFIAQRSETLYHLKNKLGEDFAKSPEGKEALFLKDVLEHYVKKFENFLAHFISGKQGRRGIDTLISGLEHPQSQVKPDKILIDSLKRSASEADKAGLLHWEQFNHYGKIKQDARTLRPLSDIHVFIAHFNELLVRACGYEQATVAQAIKKRSQKDLPNMITLENFEFAITAWKFIFAHLYRPDQESKAMDILGSQKFDGFEDEVARRLKIDAGAVKKAEQVCFPKEKEDNDISNLMAFAKSVAEEGDKNLFIRMLKATGQVKYADMLKGQFGKKGAVRADPKTVNALAALITRIDNESAREHAEIAARDELVMSITSMLKITRHQVEKEQEKFVKIIAGRVHQLEHTHAKNLEKVNEMYTSIATVDKELLEAVAVKETLMGKFDELDKARKDGYRRTLDILSVTRARLVTKQFMMSSINREKLDSEMQDVLSKKRSDFAKDAVNKMWHTVIKRIQGEIDQERFDAAMKDMDLFIDKLNSQIPAITQRESRITDETVTTMETLVDTQYVIDFELKQANDETTADTRKLKKIGIDFERISAQPDRLQAAAQNLNTAELQKFMRGIHTPPAGSEQHEKSVMKVMPEELKPLLGGNRQPDQQQAQR
ncbi:MAG: hypothetical protein V1729_03740 [Candidatus Woesearchaeota archaeon]